MAQLLQAPRDEQQSRVGHIGTAAQFEHFQILQMLRDSTETRVRDLFAEGQVEDLQVGQVGGEGVAEVQVRHVVAPAQVEGLQLRQTEHDVLQGASQGQHLDLANAPPDQRVEDVRRGSAQVQRRLYAPPHALGVGGVSPGGADLRSPAAIPHGQFAEDLREDLREQLANVSAHVGVLLLLLRHVLVQLRRLVVLLLVEVLLLEEVLMGGSMVVGSGEDSPGWRSSGPEVVLHVG